MKEGDLVRSLPNRERKAKYSKAQSGVNYCVTFSYSTGICYEFLLIQESHFFLGVHFVTPLACRLTMTHC